MSRHIAAFSSCHVVQPQESPGAQAYLCCSISPEEGYINFVLLVWTKYVCYFWYLSRLPGSWPFCLPHGNITNTPDSNDQDRYQAVQLANELII